MHLLYNIGITFLGIGMRLASIFNPKAKEWVRGRQGLLKELPDTQKRKVIWFHCASLGEFDQGLPLMHQLKDSNPNYYLLVTFFSPSGMKHYHKRKHCSDHVMYIPLDTPSNARAFIRHFQPEMSFFIKYEFWSNLIFSAKNHKSKIYNISGIFRENHRFFRWYGGVFRKTLKCFDWFYVQNIASKKLLSKIDVTNVLVTGDSRYDRVLQNKMNASNDLILDHFTKHEKTLIIGSSWPEDEKIILPYINQTKEKVIIAPHNIDEKHINALLEKLEKSYQRYTLYDNSVESEVLILDTIGHLSNAYAYAKYAYVGGGFSGNLHNILEPAVFGLPVLFGPKHDRFPEANQFIQEGFGFSVSTSSEVSETIDQIKLNFEEIRKNEIEFISEQTGATLKIFNHIISN